MIKKQQHTFKLVAVKSAAGYITKYVTVPEGFTVEPTTNKSQIKLTTRKGSYILNKHSTMNYFWGTCAGVKVQVSLKTLVGEIRSWY
jgi:hypothetical protein